MLKTFVIKNNEFCKMKRSKVSRFAPSDDKDIGIRKFEFVAKTQYSINKH